MSNVPIPEPDWILEVRQWLQDRMHTHAAAVSAAKDAEISGLRAERDNMAAAIAQLLRDNRDVHEKVVRPLRERVRVLEAARPEPDCRTCAAFDPRNGDHALNCKTCVQWSEYQPLPPVRLWRTTP